MLNSIQLVHCTNTVTMAPYTVMQVLHGTNVADRYPTFHLKGPCTISTCIVKRKVCHAE